MTNIDTRWFSTDLQRKREKLVHSILESCDLDAYWMSQITVSRATLVVVIALVWVCSATLSRNTLLQDISILKHQSRRIQYYRAWSLPFHDKCIHSSQHLPCRHHWFLVSDRGLQIEGRICPRRELRLQTGLSDKHNLHCLLLDTGSNLLHFDNAIPNQTQLFSFC